MTIGINQITSGMGLLINGELHSVSDFSHVKPGKGSAFVRVKLKNLKTGLVIERTFKTADKLEDAPLEERKMQYLYRTGDEFHFMDQTTFEEQVVPLADLGDVLKYLQDNLDVTGTCYNGRVIRVNLPIFIEAEVTETDPGLKGDSSKAGYKPATIETGATIQVPLFVNIGDYIKVDTRTGSYMERVKK